MKPLSLDLRQRIIAALDTKASQKAIAERFDVSISSVERLAAKKRQGLDLKAKTTTGRKRLVPEDRLSAFKQLVKSKNDWTAQALAEAWHQQEGKVLSISTATRVLKKLRFSFKKNPKSLWSETRKSETRSGSK
ncbi:helix-turn-helix domain-containing protein [Armatimonas sp.]|uniref:helix-turn-helix domain-containing protein n=1 Tax=Armatimonas sp. TaxID=1872638 RepID=UPI00286BE371|nr:helix-turn-helix domain-containing protein [Armatimonas sp.]